MAFGQSLQSETSEAGNNDEQFQLALEISAGPAGTGWYLYAGVYAVQPPPYYGLLTVDAETALGYVPYTSVRGTPEAGACDNDGGNCSYSYAMAAGQAQNFQIGGEIANPSGYSVPMGSGMNPDTDYPNTAYVYNINVFTSAGTYTPGALILGPITAPASFSGMNYCPDWYDGPTCYNGFSIGDVTSKTYSWQEFSIGSDMPSVFAPTRTLGSNAIVIAPVYVYDPSIDEAVFNIYALTGAAYGSNHHLKEYSSLTGTWSDVLDGSGDEIYLWGITTDKSNGALWGWDNLENVWTNDGRSSIQELFTEFTSIAPSSASDWAVGSYTNAGTCSPSGAPSGPCLLSSTFPVSGWSTFGGYGGEQVTLDSVNQTLYALGESNHVWSWSGSAWSEMVTTKCVGGGAFSPVQIAAQNNVVFGLAESGGVYYATTGSCWTQIGTGTSFESIATDNGDTVAVWATDSSGYVWVATPTP